MSNNAKKNSKSGKKTTTPVKNVHLGDGVLDAAKNSVNEGTKKILTSLIDRFFEYLGEKANDIPEKLKKVFQSPDTKKEILSLWSTQLYEQGIIPAGYNGLPDELFIRNCKQDGYLDGMYSGVLITMVTLLEKGVSKEDILNARQDIMPKLLGETYERRDTLCTELKEMIQNWSVNSNSDITTDTNTDD